ncbi:hypothetical protein GCM10009619_39880 [Williamsia maris]
MTPRAIWKAVAPTRRTSATGDTCGSRAGSASAPWATSIALVSASALVGTGSGNGEVIFSGRVGDRWSRPNVRTHRPMLPLNAASVKRLGDFCDRFERLDGT